MQPHFNFLSDSCQWALVGGVASPGSYDDAANYLALGQSFGTQQSKPPREATGKKKRTEFFLLLKLER